MVSNSNHGHKLTGMAFCTWDTGSLDKELLRAISKELSIIALILEGDYLWPGKGSPLLPDFLRSDPVHTGYVTGWRDIMEDTQLHNSFQFNIIRKGSAVLIRVRFIIN